MSTSINITTNAADDDDVEILMVKHNSDWITITGSFCSRKYVPLWHVMVELLFSHIRLETKQNVGYKTQP